MRENSFNEVFFDIVSRQHYAYKQIKSIQEMENVMPAKPAHERIRSELGRGVRLSKCRHCGCMKGALEEMAALLSSRHEGKFSALHRDISSWLNRLEETLYT